MVTMSPLADVRDFVAQHGFYLVGAHVVQQAGADRHQRVVAAHAGGKGVWFRGIEDADLRHADARLPGLALDGVKQPLLGTIRRVDRSSARPWSASP